MNINDILFKNGMSQYALSKKSGVPYSTISDLCLGKTNIRKCNVETAYKIACALDCKIETLLDSKKEAEFTGEYMTIAEYYRSKLLNRKNVILYGESALDYMRLTNGGSAMLIEVYSTSTLNYPFISHKVKNFDNIQYQVIDGILVSTLSQALNDMFENEDTDLQVLDEALSNYYYQNNESFDGLQIKDCNIIKFNKEKEYAIGYYNTY